MKKALFKDSIKEIKNTYKKFISILLMSFLGVGFFAGIRAAVPDMLDTLDKYYKSQDVFDIQIISPIGLNDEDVEKISQIENIETIDMSFEADGIIKTENTDTVVKLISLGKLNKTVVLEGRLPKAQNECVVEEKFLTETDKKIGDTIDIEIENIYDTNGNEIQFLNSNQMKIVGTVQSPLYISADRGTSNLGVGKINYFLYVLEDNINFDLYTKIYVKVKGADKYITSEDDYKDCVQKVKDDIENIQDEDEIFKWYVLDRTSNRGYAGFIQDKESIASVASVFPLVFFAVATLISLTSMARMVEEQRMQIGTLKALGYNSFQIASKYILYASLASCIGALLGMCVGFYLLPSILWELYKAMYTITDNISIGFKWNIGGIGLILISVCIIGATMYAVIKELRSMPATLMRPKAPKSGNRVILEKIKFIWKKLNFSQKVTVRNLFRYKKRFIMTIIGIMGCTSLLVTGFGIKDSIGAVLSKQYENVFDYDLQISLNDFANVEQIKENKKFEKIVETYMTTLKGINNENEEDIQLIVPDKYFDNLINLRNAKSKNTLKLKDGEIYLTNKVAELLDVKQGDFIKLKDSDNKEYEVKISEIVENYVSHYIYMTKATYENITGKSYNTNVLLAKNINLSSEEEDIFIKDLIQNLGISGVTKTKDTMSFFDDTLQLLDYVVIILIISAGLLAFVVLYNLENVNISERIRELATIKVLGFYDKEVYKYVSRESTILTIIGITLGLVAGYCLNSFILGTCEIDMLKFAKVVKIESYLYSILITIVFTVIVNIATYFSLKKINMIESLKSVE